MCRAAADCLAVAGAVVLEDSEYAVLGRLLGEAKDVHSSDTLDEVPKLDDEVPINTKTVK